MAFFKKLSTVLLKSCLIHTIDLIISINGKWKVYNEYKNYLLARYYKPKVVEKHFSKISKLSRVEARQINNGLTTEFYLQQDIVLSCQIWES